MVHAIKTNLLENAPLLKNGVAPRLPLVGEEGEGTLTEEAIWSCTTCGACLEACPVLIEQMPKIVNMRRHLVQMESRFPEELLNLFENMEGRSNPWGIAPSERSKWCSQLDVQPFEAGKTEYLFYVGCAGAFDSRSKQVTVALATILDAAGVSWGILGKDEKCCGCGCAPEWRGLHDDGPACEGWQGCLPEGGAIQYTQFQRLRLVVLPQDWPPGAPAPFRPPRGGGSCALGKNHYLEPNEAVRLVIARPDAGPARPHPFSHH